MGVYVDGQVFALQVRLGRITLAQVPAQYRDAVRELIREGGA